MKKTYLNFAPRYHSRRFPQPAYAAVAYKEDAVLTKEDVLKELGEVKTSLETSLTKKLDDSKAEMIKAAGEEVDKKIKAIQGLPEGVTAEELIKMKADLATTIKDFDVYQKRDKDSPLGAPKAKYLDDAVGEYLASDDGKAKVEEALKTTKGKIIMPLKGKILMQSKSAMTVANTITVGDPVATYNQRQAILPSQKVNFRDLIPTAMSETGLYVTYKETTATANNIAKQTEGSSKGENNYTLSEVKTVNNYIAGTVTFTKQLMRSASWMQSTLVRMLLRDFYKSENAYFFSTVSQAATGTTSGGTSPNDITQLITLMGAIKDTNFDVSFVIVSNTLLARLINLTFTNGYYPGAGLVFLPGMGLSIWGVPIIGASWVTANYALLIDADYLERVEVEGLNIAFSFEEGNNFTKNEVTSRVECFEEINLMLPQSASFMNLGAS